MSEEQVDPERLRKFAEQLEPVLTAIETAAKKIEGAEIGGAAFSHYGLDMAIAYPSAHAFGVRNADGKKAHVDTIRQRLGTTATYWDSAESSSTVKH